MRKRLFLTLLTLIIILKGFRPEVYAHKSVQQRYFSFLATAHAMTNWVNIFTDLLFYAYVGTHQREGTTFSIDTPSELIFDNYETFPVPLNHTPRACLKRKEQNIRPRYFPNEDDHRHENGTIPSSMASGLKINTGEDTQRMYLAKIKK